MKKEQKVIKRSKF